MTNAMMTAALGAKGPWTEGAVNVEDLREPCFVPGFGWLTLDDPGLGGLLARMAGKVAPATRPRSKHADSPRRFRAPREGGDVRAELN